MQLCSAAGRIAPRGVLPGHGPRGEEGALSTEEVPKERDSTELHDAKTSVCALYLLVFTFAK